jgi:anti-sigma factor RsiW
MTPDQARELFSAAFERELDEAQQGAFDAALAADGVLAREYRAFAEMLELTRGTREPQGAVGRPPDLLPGVQRKLRARSRGRFYGDRFAERHGSSSLQPLPLALFTLALLALGWAVVALLSGVSVTP